MGDTEGAGADCRQRSLGSDTVDERSSGPDGLSERLHRSGVGLYRSDYSTKAPAVGIAHRGGRFAPAEVETQHNG
jgi:hypothetical protein